MNPSIPHYFRPATTRLVIFSILTLGMYTIYWAYKNWEAIRVFDKRNIEPLSRAVFSVFYIYQLLTRMAKDVAGKPSVSYSTAKKLAIIFIGLTALQMILAIVSDVTHTGFYTDDTLLGFIVPAIDTVFSTAFVWLVQKTIFGNAVTPVVESGTPSNGEKIATGIFIFLTAVYVTLTFILPDDPATSFEPVEFPIIETPRQIYIDTQ